MNRAMHRDEVYVEVIDGEGEDRIFLQGCRCRG